MEVMYFVPVCTSSYHMEKHKTYNGSNHHKSVSARAHAQSLNMHHHKTHLNVPHGGNNNAAGIVLKLRIANLEDKDFIEVDLDKSSLTYENLVSLCCHEFDVKAHNIKRVRKLPNTIVRNDKNVKRLLPFQELEIVLKREKDIGE